MKILSIRMGSGLLAGILAVNFLVVARAADQSATPAPKRTQKTLAALTPARVLEKLKTGNERFVQSLRRDHDHLADVQFTATSQYPIAAVLGCMDSRAPAPIIFDQGIGDLFTLGVAGNVLNDDAVGSLEYAGRVVGSKVIVVLGHTECGAVKGAIDHVDLGSLTGLLEKIESVIDDVPSSVTPRTSKNKAFVDAVAEANVRHVLSQIRERSPILRDLEKNGSLQIVGAMYDVRTGRVTFL